MDRANRVRLLINTAFDYVYGWSEREVVEPWIGKIAGHVLSGYTFIMPRP